MSAYERRLAIEEYVRREWEYIKFNEIIANKETNTESEKAKVLVKQPIKTK